MGLLVVRALLVWAFAALPCAGAAFQIESSEGKDGVAGEIHATVAQPFAMTAPALGDPSNWCEILMLHLDTKECHVSTGGAGTTVSVGVVSKYDQPVSTAYRLSFVYRRDEDTASALKVRLDGDTGPLGTSHYRIVLDAAPAPDGQTSIHMAYSYSYGVMAHIAMAAYLATFGRNKVGFTVVGNGADGQPRYIGGIRGVVERNTMRYYLAVESWLDAMTLPGDARAEKSLRNWYAAIERFPR